MVPRYGKLPGDRRRASSDYFLGATVAKELSIEFHLFLSKGTVSVSSSRADRFGLFSDVARVKLTSRTYFGKMQSLGVR
jgi:hypothetical protein